MCLSQNWSPVQESNLRRGFPLRFCRPPPYHSASTEHIKLAGTVGLAPTIFRVRTDCIAIMLRANVKLEPHDRLALSSLVYETNTSLSMFMRQNWGVQRESNPHRPASQSGALGHYATYTITEIILLTVPYFFGNWIYPCKRNLFFN